MRIVLVVIGFLLSVASAQAEKVVVSGRPLILYHAFATNPDCSVSGPIVMRVSQAPEHGRVSIHSASMFPNYPATGPRSECNRRRVRGVEATYVSQRGYIGPDIVVLEIFFPAGRGIRATLPIRVM